MIVLTRMDKQVMYLNPDHIISVEETPDTVITLFNGNHYIVKESAGTIISRIVAFRSRILRRAGVKPGKKYLYRVSKNQFRRSNVRNNDIHVPNDHDSIDRTTFHTRDY